MQEKKTNKQSTHTIWLVGGGTAGHIMPLLAVAEKLNQYQSIKLAYVGDREGREASLARQAGLPFLSIPNGKFRRYLSFLSVILNLRDLYRIAKGVVIARRLIRKKKPALIFSKGGPVALPVALAARMTGTPLITHESDAVIGLTNRLIARFADTILTAFPSSVYPSHYAKKIISVGLPIRKEFCEKGVVAHRSKRPMILITGGSQGAVAINEAVLAILPDLLRSVSVMHITGRFSYDRFMSIKESLPPELNSNYGVIDFTPDMATYMREATLIISRASSTIFEIAAIGKPLILIPLPNAANNHQLKNAEIFLRYNAALLLNQENLTPTLLYETITTLIRDKNLRNELKEGIRNFNSCDAAKRVADILMQHVR